mgnify:CR=1 FL=1
MKVWCTPWSLRYQIIHPRPAPEASGVGSGAPLESCSTSGPVSPGGAPYAMPHAAGRPFAGADAPGGPSTDAGPVEGGRSSSRYALDDSEDPSEPSWLGCVLLGLTLSGVALLTGALAVLVARVG